MNEEEVIKNRLIVDGDGTGEDRRLNLLLKQFLKWTNSKNDTPETNQLMHDRLKAHLGQCQFFAKKSELTLKMMQEEKQNYGKLSTTIEDSIEQANAEIEACKAELAIAKQIRKNKMEYDLLAKLIEEEPDRKEMQEKIEVIKKEIEELILQKVKLEHKFHKRRNDFALLMYALHELEQQLDEEVSSVDEKVEIIENVSNGVMEVSDDENIPSSTKSPRKNVDTMGGDHNNPSVSTDDSKERMSVDEDAVLELSLDKDEQDVETHSVAQ